MCPQSCTYGCTDTLTNELTVALQSCTNSCTDAPAQLHLQPVASVIRRRLETQLNRTQDRMPPLLAPIPTETVVSALVVSVFMRCRRCCGRHRSTSGLLLCTDCTRTAYIASSEELMT